MTVSEQNPFDEVRLLPIVATILAAVGVIPFVGMTSFASILLGLRSLRRTHLFRWERPVSIAALVLGAAGLIFSAFVWLYVFTDDSCSGGGCDSYDIHGGPADRPWAELSIFYGASLTFGVLSWGFAALVTKLSRSARHAARLRSMGAENPVL
jgi:hypothetical protein